MYVLQRTSDGAYVSRPGSASSYTRRLELAQPFTTAEAAARSACENERVVDTEALWGPNAIKERELVVLKHIADRLKRRRDEGNDNK